MNTQEHLLVILSEECAELAQQASKAIRFGLNDIEPDQLQTNAERLQREFADLLGVYDLLVSANWLKSPSSEQIAEKTDKVHIFMKYSQSVGTLNGKL